MRNCPRGVRKSDLKCKRKPGPKPRIGGGGFGLGKLNKYKLPAIPKGHYDDKDHLSPAHAAIRFEKCLTNSQMNYDIPRFWRLDINDPRERAEIENQCRGDENWYQEWHTRWNYTYKYNVD